MFFVIQSDHTDDIEVAIIKSILRQYRQSHSYVTMAASDFYVTEEDEETFQITTREKTADDFDDRFRTGIPLGNISFVERYLQIFYGVDHENAIEVPPILRSDKFLKRKYSIVPLEKVPRTGKFFLKDATRQKELKYAGDLSLYINDEMYNPPMHKNDFSIRFDKTHLYQVSELVNVFAEYRIYVLQGEINSNSFFAGNPLIFPDADLIHEAVELFSFQPDAPRSYSLDVMVNERGTSITEVHNFTSLGLYSVDWDDNLLYAYKDGLDYILNYNTEQTEFSNF